MKQKADSACTAECIRVHAVKRPMRFGVPELNLEGGRVWPEIRDYLVAPPPTAQQYDDASRTQEG